MMVTSQGDLLQLNSLNIASVYNLELLNTSYCTSLRAGHMRFLPIDAAPTGAVHIGGEPYCVPSHDAIHKLPSLETSWLFSHGGSQSNLSHNTFLCDLHWGHRTLALPAQPLLSMC